MLTGILDGGLKFFLPAETFHMPIPKWALNVVSNQTLFAKVTLSVWTKKRIIVVEADGLPRGWFPVQRLKSRTIKVNNFMLGVEPMSLALSKGVHDELQVWLDMLLEKGVLPVKGATALSERESVRADPRVDSMHQEVDGYCDADTDWRRPGPPRQAWWVYLVNTWIDEDMGCGSIHECKLATVIEHLERYVHPATPEETAEIRWARDE